jgi:hypothetical protein
MNGFRIDCDSQDFPGPIETVVLPLLSKYWLVCTQGGPFSTTDKPNFQELDAETCSFIIDVPEFRDTDVHLFRPGVFRRFASLLVVDEWAYLFALDGPEESARQNALRIEECAGDWLSRTFFEAVESSALGFFMYVDGFWEVYLRDQSSHANLLAHGFAEVHSEHWLHDRQGPSHGRTWE